MKNEQDFTKQIWREKGRRKTQNWVNGVKSGPVSLEHAVYVE